MTPLDVVMLGLTAFVAGLTVLACASDGWKW
jgi:hypothetical protein